MGFGTGSDAPQPTYLNDVSDQILSRPSGPFAPPASTNVPPGACDSPDSNIIEFVTITKIAAGGAKGDILVQPSGGPYRVWFLASIQEGHINEVIYAHFTKLGKSYSGNTIPLDGTENWLALYRGNAGAGEPMNQTALKFCKPISRLFIDVSQGGGGGDYQLTIGCTNDLDVIGQLAGFE